MFAGLLYKKTKVLLRTICAFSIHVYSLERFDLADGDVRQPVQPRIYVRLLVFDETSVQPHFAVVNCSGVVMSVFYIPVLTRSLILFASMNWCVKALSVFSSDILTLRADSLYCVQ